MLGRKSKSVAARLACAALALSTVVVAPTPTWAAERRVECGPPGTSDMGSTPWALLRLKPDNVWHLTRGQGVVVAVIDSGVSDVHPALVGQVLPGADLTGLNAAAGRCDQAGHGTVVAGIIAGKDLNDSLFNGIAPGAKILPIRVLVDEQKSSDKALPARIAQSIRTAVDKGATVLNLSLETADVPQLRDAIAYAQSKNVVVVAAAGNVTAEGVELPAYPAAYDSVLAVAGVDQTGKHAESSVTGEYIDVAAPGTQIIGPAPRGNRFRTYDAGTSFATAYVTGVVALVRAYYPEMKAQDVVRRVMETADNPASGRNTLVGYGVVNPYRAVTAFLGKAPAKQAGTIPLPSATVDPLHRVKVIAPYAAIGGLLLAGLLLLAGPVLKRGRRRGWRPS